MIAPLIGLCILSHWFWVSPFMENSIFYISIHIRCSKYKQNMTTNAVMSISLYHIASCHIRWKSVWESQKPWKRVCVCVYIICVCACVRVCARIEHVKQSLPKPGNFLTEKVKLGRNRTRWILRLPHSTQKLMHVGCLLNYVKCICVHSSAKILSVGRIDFLSINSSAFGHFPARIKVP